MLEKINRIETTFGKKGSGKTNLMFNQMARAGGKIVYFSPVQDVPFDFNAVWEIESIPGYMAKQKPGQILHIKNVHLDAFDLVCCQAVIHKQFSIFIDEADHYIKSSELSDLIDYGRHSANNVYGNTRRYTDIPRKLTANSDIINIFRTNEPRDLQYLREFCGKEILTDIQALPDYHYIRYDTDSRKFDTLMEKSLTK